MDLVSVYLLILFFFFLCRPHLWHVEVPVLGAELELQLQAYTTAMATLDPSCTFNLRHRFWQHWIFNPLVKPEIEPISS